jgi:hypothetical protein
VGFLLPPLFNALLETNSCLGDCQSMHNDRVQFAGLIVVGNIDPPTSRKKTRARRSN